MTLLNLPPELLEKIAVFFDDLASHIAYYQLCRKTRFLYAEEQFESLLTRAGFARSNLFSARPHSEIACGIVCHSLRCPYCKEALLRQHPLSAARQQGHVFAETRAAPVVKLNTQLRQSIGTFSIIWSKSNLRDRPCLSLPAYEQVGSEDNSVDGRLLAHPTLACMSAFTVPLRTIRCGFEADDDWQFDGYFEDIYQDSELGAGQPSALNYRTQAVNDEGLTCLDVLVMASDVPGLPISERSLAPLTYNGLLDDAIRQGIIWVQGRS